MLCKKSLNQKSINNLLINIFELNIHKPAWILTFSPSFIWVNCFNIFLRAKKADSQIVSGGWQKLFLNKKKFR